MKIFVFTIVILISGITSFAATVYVPTQQNSIQAGINASNNGDTILVANGIYFENNISFGGKEVVLISENGPLTTIIDGSTSGKIFICSDGTTFNTEINGFTIQNGQANEGAAIHLINTSYLTVKNCIISANNAPGIWTRAAITIGQEINNGPYTPAGIHLFDCKLEGNSGYYGGAVFNGDSGGTPSIFERCVFLDNVGSSGSAIFGTINSVIKNCLFYNNISNTSIINNEGGYPQIINCTFADNQGYAICRNNSTTNTTIRNSIFYGNTGTWCEITNPSTIVMEYCDDQDNNVGVGNFNSNPLFFNSGVYDYTLQSLSPCIDTGDPNPTYNDPDGTRNDVGAYYYPQCIPTNSSESAIECNSYTWSTNGQTYTQTGQYTEVLTNQNGCDSTVTLNLTINSSSSSSQTDTGLDSYTWSVNNQTYTQSGTYTAVIPNASGCDSTITLDLTIQFTGLDENESSYVAVYPNPTFNSFTLSTKDMTNMNYTLLDLQGKVVLKGKIESTEETVDISHLSKGQYNLVFEDESISPISIIKN